MASPNEKPPIAFIGLGAMGFGMATHLVSLAYPVTGFDVYAPTLSRFLAAGGLAAPTPAAAVSNKPFCVCMVATAAQAQAVLLDGPDAAVPSLPRGAVLMLCSTVPCEYVQALGRQLREVERGDVLLVDCPVSGGAARAAEGTLSIMAGGSPEALEAARPVLKEMADPAKLYEVKGGVGAGSNMKMVHQVLAACQILAASEAMGLGARLGLGLEEVQREVLASEAWNWMFEHRSPRMLTNFQPVASAVNIIVKDTGIITAEAKRSGFRVPLTSAAEAGYREAVGRGYGTDDDSSLLRLYIDGGSDEGAAPGAGSVKTDEEKLALVVDLLKAINLCAAAESLSFAHFVGLDLEQVLDLCVNAAGASTMLKQHGPGFIEALRAGAASKDWAAKDDELGLESVVDRLRVVIDEAQKVGVRLFLGTQALEVLSGALKSGKQPAVSSLVNLWAAFPDA